MTPAAILVQALEEGKLLTYQVHGTADTVFYFWLEKHPTGSYFERRGFASAVIPDSEALRSIVLHPERWEISPVPVSDYPWSAAYQK